MPALSLWTRAGNTTLIGRVRVVGEGEGRGGEGRGGEVVGGEGCGGGGA